MTKLLE